eukprot:2724255-Alexandrium_andersonii.AAC.1
MTPSAIVQHHLAIGPSCPTQHAHIQQSLTCQSRGPTPNGERSATHGWHRAPGQSPPTHGPA